MALNLNKGNDDISKPSTEKKGLNLSKSGDNVRENLNLSEDSIGSANNSSLSNTRTGVKKKLPILIISLVIILVGIGIFWSMNNKENDSAVKSDVENLSAISEEIVAPATTLEDQPAIESVEAIDETKEQLSSSNGNNGIQETTSSNATNSSSSQPSSKTSATSSPHLQGTIEEKARQVISGAFGNGADRKNALGAEYAAIQAKVNEIYRNGIN